KHLYLQATSPGRPLSYDDEALGNDYYVPTDFTLRQAVFSFFLILCAVGATFLSIEVGLS
ncbi:hypothetical protein, partial [Salmonella sp. s51228]|uniref:hypothetical protein n=1 Tax=Salmonella sp. s51228 TaxID=3159652 RepID=UPI0039813FDF